MDNEEGGKVENVDIIGPSEQQSNLLVLTFNDYGDRNTPAL